MAAIQAPPNVNTFRPNIHRNYHGFVAGTPESYVEVFEGGDKVNRWTKLTFNTTLPAIAGGANLAVGKKLYTLPAGEILITGTSMSVAIEGATAIQADTPDIGIGTTIATGAVAVLGGTAAFENILTGQTMTDCNGTETVATVSTNLVIATAGSHVVYLNVADGWAAGGDAAADVSGTILLTWKYLS